MKTDEDFLEANEGIKIRQAEIAEKKQQPAPLPDSVSKLDTVIPLVFEMWGLPYGR